MDEVSPGAKKLLKYLQEAGLSQGESVYPADVTALFDTPEEAEAAETELEKLGLIKLGEPRPGYESSRVRSAALTIEGDRFKLE
jgi:hypothetical protein